MVPDLWQCIFKKNNISIRQTEYANANPYCVLKGRLILLFLYDFVTCLVNSHAVPCVAAEEICQI